MIETLGDRNGRGGGAASHPLIRRKAAAHVPSCGHVVHGVSAESHAVSESLKGFIFPASLRGTHTLHAAMRRFGTAPPYKLSVLAKHVEMYTSVCGI